MPCVYIAAHSSYCGSMNVKDLVTEDASHLNLNGSLCKQALTHTHTHACAHFLTRSMIDRVNDMRDLCLDQRAKVV